MDARLRRVNKEITGLFASESEAKAGILTWFPRLQERQDVQRRDRVGG